MWQCWKGVPGLNSLARPSLRENQDFDAGADVPFGPVGYGSSGLSATIPSKIATVAPKPSPTRRLTRKSGMHLQGKALFRSRAPDHARLDRSRSPRPRLLGIFMSRLNWEKKKLP